MRKHLTKAKHHLKLHFPTFINTWHTKVAFYPFRLIFFGLVLLLGLFIMFFVLRLASGSAKIKANCSGPNLVKYKNNNKIAYAVSGGEINNKKIFGFHVRLKNREDLNFIPPANATSLDVGDVTTTLDIAYYANTGHFIDRNYLFGDSDDRVPEIEYAYIYTIEQGNRNDEYLKGFRTWRMCVDGGDSGDKPTDTPTPFDVPTNDSTTQTTATIGPSLSPSSTPSRDQKRSSPYPTQASIIPSPTHTGVPSPSVSASCYVGMSCKRDADCGIGGDCRTKSNKDNMLNKCTRCGKEIRARCTIPGRSKEYVCTVNPDPWCKNSWCNGGCCKAK